MNAKPDWRLSAPGAVPLAALKRSTGPNVSGLEQWASIAGGAALVALGLRRGGVLGAAVGLGGATLLGRGLTGRCPAKAALSPSTREKDIAEQQGWSRASVTGHAVTIGRPREEVYAFFRDFLNLVAVMENIERIEVRDATHSHWVVQGPFGKTVAFDSVLTNEEPGRHFAWRSVEGSGLDNAGTVTFREAPGGRGTEVHVLMAFNPPGGMLGRTVAGVMMKDPAVMLRQDLKRVKMKLETGEVATSKAPDASPRGKGFPRPSPL